jgi:hypothetical protein
VKESPYTVFWFHSNGIRCKKWNDVRREPLDVSELDKSSLPKLHSSTVPSSRSLPSRSLGTSVLKALTSTSNLRSLHLRVCILVLVEFLQSIKTLKCFKVHWSGLEDDQLALLSRALLYHPHSKNGTWPVIYVGNMVWML